MLELSPTDAAVIGCYAAPAALDALDALDHEDRAVVCRVAPDEAMVVGPPSAGNELLTAATARLTSVDADALVLDTTDGWAVWTLAGGSPRAALELLSPLDLRDASFAQGEVGGVPARVLASTDRVDIVVSAMWGEHMRRCVVESCADIGVRCSTASRAWGERRAAKETAS